MRGAGLARLAAILLGLAAVAAGARAAEPLRFDFAPMTDTDDTGERAVAYHDAITLGPARRE